LTTAPVSLSDTILRGLACKCPRCGEGKLFADFLSLLDAERTQLAAEDGVARAEASVFTGVVGVYEAFGGAGQ